MNYAKILLALCSLLLLTSSSYILFQSMKQKGTVLQFAKGTYFPKEKAEVNNSVTNSIMGGVPGVPIPGVPLNRSVSINVERLCKIRQQISVAGARWEGHGEIGLFASPPHILKEGKLMNPKLINPFTNAESIHPPIPNDWLIKYHLEYWKPDLLETDIKGDGFTVLENYLTNTDPIDPNIHAAPYVKLRLKKMVCEPFGVTFTGTADEGKTFMINIRNGVLQTTQFLKLGDCIRIKDSSYALKSYRKKMMVRMGGLEVDVSELTLEHSMEQIVLKTGKEVNFPTCYAIFQYYEKEIRVKKAATFILPHRQDYPYRLFDVTRRQAIVESIKGGEKHVIPTSDERFN